MYADLSLALADVTREVFTPRARPPVDQWCDTHRTISIGGKGGEASARWNTDRVPYLREPLRRYTDPEVRETTFQKSAQTGLTEALFCVVCYESAVNHRPLLYVYPTARKGAEVNKDRLVPALMGCGPLRKKLGGLGSRAIVDSKIRLGTSMVQFAYTQSRDSLRGDPFPVVLNDEVDTFDFSGEDPIQNGRSRQSTFEDAASWHVSTPMGDSSGITELYNRSDVRWTYQTPCPECGDFFELWDWGIVEWLGGMDADPQVAAANCWLRCPCCDQRIGLGAHRWMIQHGLWLTQGESIESDGRILESIDAHRTLVDGWEMLSRLGGDVFRKEGTGDWGLATGEEGIEEDLFAGYSDEARRYGVRIVGERVTGPKHGYRICSMQSLVYAEGIGGLVREFLEHDGRPGPTWWRDRLGRSPSTRGERVEVTDLELLCVPVDHGGHRFGECPEWAVACFGGVDVQKGCVKWSVNAYGPEGRRKALVAAGEVPRDEQLRLEDIRGALLDIGDFPVAGHRRRLTPAWLIDSGHWTREVYDLVHEVDRTHRRGHIIACKGMSSPENRPEPYRTSRIREMRTPGGHSVALPYELELVMVNGHLLRDARAPRLVPMDAGLVERLRSQMPAGPEGDRQLEAMLDRVRPVQLPDRASWPEGLMHRVLAEIAEDEKVTIGVGSGRSGADGRGRERQVWRKRVIHRPNDWGDCDIYADACAERWGIAQLTAERARRLVERVEHAAAGGETRTAARPRVDEHDSIAGSVADPGRFDWD